MRRRLKSILAAMGLVLSMSVGVTALAGGTDPVEPESISGVEIKKVYSLLNNGTTSPAETFTFTVTNEAVEEAEGVTKDSMPKLLYDDKAADEVTITYSEGGATITGNTQTATLTFPTYTHPGIYTYKITETSGTTAGVVYDDNEIYVTATVTYNEAGNLEVSGLKYTNMSGTKITEESGFVNEYQAADLQVTKKLEGNMADKEKEFEITINLTAPADLTYQGIKWSIAGVDQTNDITLTAGGTVTQKVELKGDETVIFKNLPYGVTYTVTEKDYTSDGYEKPVYTVNEENRGTVSVSNEAIDEEKEEVIVTNRKGTDISTGVTLDNLPYLILLALVILGVVFVVLRRRPAADRD